MVKPLPLALNMKSRNDMTKKSRVAIFYYFRSFNLRAFIWPVPTSTLCRQGNTVRLLMRWNNKEVSHFDVE
jgi:hypothetical protein